MSRIIFRHFSRNGRFDEGGDTNGQLSDDTFMRLYEIEQMTENSLTGDGFRGIMGVFRDWFYYMSVWGDCQMLYGLGRRGMGNGEWRMENGQLTIDNFLFRRGAIHLRPERRSMVR